MEEELLVPAKQEIRIKRYKTTRTKHVHCSKKEICKNSEKPARLAPVRLDIDVDGVRLRDSFMWNLNETLITPEQFAEMMVDDIEGPLPANIATLIAQDIRNQCEMYQDVAAPENIEEEDEDFRIVIKLDIDVGKLRLQDQFEWSLYSQVPTPEDFARQLASDLGLGGEFAPVIAHSIREQICTARLNFDEAVEAPLLIEPPIRVDGSEWIPNLSQLDEAEMERRQLVQERANRRRRRANRATTKNLPPPITESRHSALPIPQRRPNMYEANRSQTLQHQAVMNQYNANQTKQNSFSPNASSLHQQQVIHRSAAPTMSMFAPSQFYSPQFPGAASSPQYQHQAFQANPQNIPYRNHVATPQELMSMSIPSGIQFGNINSFNAFGGNTMSMGIASLNGTANSMSMMLMNGKSGNFVGSGALAGSKSPSFKNPRAFGASATMFNADGSVEVGEFRKNWRCQWCHIPGQFTPTLRKGPNGGKTLCNACGIWFAKHDTLPPERYQEHINMPNNPEHIVGLNVGGVKETLQDIGGQGTMESVAS